MTQTRKIPLEAVDLYTRLFTAGSVVATFSTAWELSPSPALPVSAIVDTSDAELRPGAAGSQR